MSLPAPRWLSSILISLPVGILAAAVAIVGAGADPRLPVVVGVLGATFAVGYLRPLWLIYAGLLALPLEFAIQGVAFFELTAAKGLFLLAAAAWVLHQLVQRRPLIADSALTLPLIVLVVIILPGLVVAQEKLVVFNQLAIWVAWFCLFQAVIQAEDDAVVRRVMMILAIAGVGLGMLAITDPGFQGGPASGGGGAAIAGRATGGLSSPNGLAALLMTTVLPALCLTFFGPRWRRVAFGAAAGIGIVGIMLTESRGGFLGLTAGLLVLITWRPVRRIAIVAGVTIAILAFVGVNPLGRFLDETSVGERISSITTTAPQSDPRIPVYRHTLEVIRDNPLFGVGTNDYLSAAVAYGIMTSGAALSHAHNIPLTIAAERGLLGLAAFIYFAFALGIIIKRGLAEERDREKRALLTGVMAVFVACAAHGLVDYTLGSTVLLAELFLLAGCAVVLTRRDQPRVSAGPEFRPHAA